MKNTNFANFKSLALISATNRKNKMEHDYRVEPKIKVSLGLNDSESFTKESAWTK